VLEVLTRLSDHDATHMAASLSYYALLSTFPLVIGVLGLISFFLEDPELRARIVEEFTERFVDRMASLTVGDPNDSGTDVGPQAREDLMTTLHEQVTASVEAGATVHCGGEPLDRDGYFYPPTVLTDVPRDAPAATDRLIMTTDRTTVPTAAAEVIWDTLMDAGSDYGITPAGMLALDMARVEAGLLLIDVDYTPARKALIENQKSSPYELDLAWTVDLEKSGYFVGRKALEAERRSGSRWATVGVEVDWHSLAAAYAQVDLTPALPHTAWRSSVPLFSHGRLADRQIGYATSGCFSPILKRYITLATVAPAHAQVGTKLKMEVTVEHVPHRVAARVVPKPFFDPERKRA
jgi:hypothetical protein